MPSTEDAPRRGAGIGKYGRQPAARQLWRLRVTQKQVAAMAGTQDSNVCRVLNGQFMPGVELVEAVAQFTGWPVEQCWTEDALERYRRDTEC